MTNHSWLLLGTTGKGAALDEDSDDVVYCKYCSHIVEAYYLFLSAWALFFFFLNAPASEVWYFWDCVAQEYGHGMKCISSSPLALLSVCLHWRCQLGSDNLQHADGHFSNSKEQKVSKYDTQAAFKMSNTSKICLWYSYTDKHKPDAPIIPTYFTVPFFLLYNWIHVFLWALR